MQTPDRITRLWPDESKGPWLLAMRLMVVSGRIECVGVELRSFLQGGVDAPEDLERWWDVLPIASHYGHDDPDMEIRQPGKAYSVLGLSQDGKQIGRVRRVDIVPVNTLALRMPLANLLVEARNRAATALATLVEREGTNEGREALIEKARVFVEDARSGRGRKGHPVEHYAEVTDVYRRAHARGEHPTQAVSRHFSVSKTTGGKKVARARALGLLGVAAKGKPGETERRK